MASRGTRVLAGTGADCRPGRARGFKDSRAARARGVKHTRAHYEFARARVRALACSSHLTCVSLARSCYLTCDLYCMKSLGTVRGAPYTISADEHPRSSLGAIRTPKSTQGSSCVQLGPVRRALNTLHAMGPYMGPTGRTRGKAKVTFHGGTAAK